MHEQAMLYPRYRIETSGWDQWDQFFVEECTLEWSESSEKRILLKHHLREGSVLFVRLIPPTAGGESFPVVYRAEKVGALQADGRREIELSQLRPLQAKRTQEVIAAVFGNKA